ncbi:hypothetical protein ACIQUQ_15830 [Streptomyces sp. NPDC101118]|uniref:hypothetical protein n=1 Tax=Streptomyces sp. NPDC101118 TaxID=3366109 RepID=UPI0037FA1055
MTGRRPAGEPGGPPPAPHGAGVSIGGHNSGPVQNVVGRDVTHVAQYAGPVPGTVTPAEVRERLAEFRAALDAQGADLPNAAALRALADEAGEQLSVPDAQPGPLRNLAGALSALAAGTALQAAAGAFAGAITALLGGG